MNLMNQITKLACLFSMTLALSVPHAHAGIRELLASTGSIETELTTSSLARPMSSVEDAVTTAYVQNRVLQWSLYQTTESHTLSEAERFAQLIDVIERYVEQPAIEYSPTTFAEAKQIIDKALEAPLLVEHEMQRILIDGNLPPRVVIKEDKLRGIENRKTREYLVNAELKVTVKPLGKIGETKFIGKLLNSMSTVGQRDYNIFEKIADTGPEGVKFRKALRELGPDLHTRLVSQLVGKVDQQIDEAIKIAKDRIHSTTFADPLTDHFLKVFLINYIENLPRQSIVQIAAHLMRFGYPFEKLSVADLVRLVLERADPTAVIVVQQCGRGKNVKDVLKEVFIRFEANGAVVPLYFVEALLKAIEPAGATLTVSDYAKAGSIAQTNKGELSIDGVSIEVGGRVIKPGIRELFTWAGPALYAAVTAVENDPILKGTKFSHIRGLVDDLRAGIEIEFDAIETEKRQKIARKTYQGVYNSGDWTVEMMVPSVFGKASKDAGLQHWIGKQGNFEAYDFDSFAKAHPAQTELFVQTLMFHFFKVATQGYVHGDLHPGNVIILVDPATKKMRVAILDAGMFDTLSPEVRKEVFKVVLGLQMNSSRIVAQGLFNLQDRSQLSEAELQKIIEPLLNQAAQTSAPPATNEDGTPRVIEQKNEMNQLKVLAETLIESGFLMPRSASGFMRSMIAMKNLGITVGKANVFDMFFKEATKDPKFIAEIADIARRGATELANKYVSDQAGYASRYVNDTANNAVGYVGKSATFAWGGIRDYVGSLFDQTAETATADQKLDAPQTATASVENAKEIVASAKAVAVGAASNTAAGAAAACANVVNKVSVPGWLRRNSGN